MSKFLFSYRTSQNYAPGPDSMADWNAWFRDLGSKVVDIGNPVFERSTLGNCEGDSLLGGYSIVTADDLEAAVALAETCPVLAHGGGIEVGELTRLN
jgi:YCII-related domain